MLNQCIDLNKRCTLDTLPKDFKRMLTIQYKEFIHYLDDNEYKKQTEVIKEYTRRLVAKELNELDGVA
jgi:hypothetical protein